MSMTAYRVKYLTELTDHQVQQLVYCCTEAMRDEPGHLAVVGGDLTLSAEYMLAMIKATLLEGLLYVVCIGPETEEQIVSMGAFFAHGKYLFDSIGGRIQCFSESLNDQYPETIGPLDNELFTREEARTRWWCYNLATSPEYQRRGYATAIINAVFEEVKRTGTFLGLVSATDLNVKVYISMGFKEIGGVKLDAPSGDLLIHVMTKGR
ncbi:hypothetical protein M422DRAFT_41706 [Sphaerobolus stellatus SS14]|nr:hypothetical protein M422DRAFT_41706 [Sphaerobolus stellatus SS14]